MRVKPGETKIADTRGRFLQALRNGRERSDAGWTNGRILLSNKRIVLAGTSGKRTFPLSKIEQVGGRFDVNQRVATVADYIALQFDDGEDVILVAPAEFEEFEMDLYDALLSSTKFLVRHPAVEGGVVQNTEWERAKMQVETEAVNIATVAGTFVGIQLDDIGDIDGYDPVPETTKAALAGTTLVFPRKVSADALRERLAMRLKEEYEVGYVDAEFDGGDLDTLSLGARQAGLGPTLAPGDAAVPIRADPPNAASPGDVVQVYERGPEPTRVATAELRATAGDVVTVACEVPEARAITGGEYRLVTLPAEPRVDREFASLLRAADETMATVTVGAASELVGTTVGDIDATVAAVRDADGGVEAIPARDRPLADGETLYVVARPEAIRALTERAA